MVFAVIINPNIRITVQMADNTERIEFALRQEIERTRGYVNPRKFLSVYDLDVQTRESILTKVSMSKNVVSASGMLRYLKVDKELLAQLVRLMDLDQDMVDLSSLFDANGPELERLGIQNSQEVRSILEKYVRLTPTAITTKVRSSEIIEAMNNAGVDEDVDHFSQSNEDKHEEVKDSIEETTSLTMDEAIMDCLTNDYKSKEKILKESMSKYNNPIHPASIVKLMDNTECVVRKIPDGYRIVNITRDDLIVLLKEAGMKIGFNQSAIAVIFNAVNKDCFEKDVRSQDELNQLITKILPELTNNISSRVDLSNPLIYDGSVERKIHFVTDNDKTKQTTKRFAKLDEADYPVIRKKLIDLMSSYEPMSFSVIRSRLILEYSPQEMRDELESMYADGLVFKKNDNTYRLHPTFSKEDIQGILSRFSSCIISVSRIYAETFIDLKKVGIVSPSELKEVMVLCDNARTIDERYNLISFDDRDPVDFIMECYEKEADKGAFAARMLREYGIPNEIIYSTVKENKGDVLFGVTSSDRKGLVDLRPSFQDKELYSKDEFMSKLSKLRPDLDMMRINSHDLSLLGFKESDGLVFPQSYSNADEYLKSLLKELDRFNVEGALIGNSKIESTLRKERREFHWLKYDENKYISIRTIERITSDSQPINEDTINDYIKKIHVVVGDELFTTKNLRLRGLTDLDILGFEDKFIEYLLETTEVRNQELKGENGESVRLFAFNKKPTLGDLIIQIVQPEGLMDLSDIKDELFRRYGIFVPESSIIRSVRKTTLKYEDSIEKVYVSKEDMRRYANDSNYN